MVAINFYLWQSGALERAERPEPMIDRPVMDPKERKAVLRRLKRWKEEGKLSAPEYEHIRRLCESEWD